MNIRPLKNKVALKEFVTESTTSSGLVLMGGVGSTPEFGVVAVGPLVDAVKINDRVLIEMGKGTIIDDMLIIEDKFITAVFNDTV
jgi:co-chaperonin GroES (HSP10)